MNVQTTKRVLKNLPYHESVLIEGDHGLGKSEVVAQVVSELSIKLNKPFQLIDFRLAQCEVGDLIGMMRHVDSAQVSKINYVNGVRKEDIAVVQNVTIHDLAEWFPTDPNSYGYLFLDELFRAPRDLQNAVMQLALDYSYHFKELPPNWRVIAATNNDLNKYMGTIPDPALYSRFLKIRFAPTVEEWVAYAESHNVHRAVLKYISKVPGDLEVPENYEPGTIVPDRRSWVKLGQNITYMAENGDDPLEDLNYLTELAIGRVGSTVGVNFVDWVRKNFKIYLPEDILDRFTDAMVDEFKTLDTSEIGYYNREIVKYIQKADKLTKKQGDNLAKYYKVIPKETAGGFWADFSEKCNEVACKWYKETPGIPEYTWSFMNKNLAMSDKKKSK